MAKVLVEIDLGKGVDAGDLLREWAEALAGKNHGRFEDGKLVLGAEVLGRSRRCPGCFKLDLLEVRE